jgi:hypothetical protein
MGELNVCDRWKNPWEHGRKVTRLREKAQKGRGGKTAATTTTIINTTTKLFSTSLIEPVSFEAAVVGSNVAPSAYVHPFAHTTTVPCLFMSVCSRCR